jgi:hypothetical protein
MKVSEIRDEYYAATGTVSDLVRQLSFAGIAIIWIFKVGKDQSGGIAFSPAMLIPLAIFVAALGADLLQYIYKSAVWGCLNTYHWRQEQKADADVKISGKWNWPAIVLFWAKAILCIWGYGVLFKQLYGAIMRAP